MHRLHLALVMLVAAALTAFATPAFAQDDAATPAGGDAPAEPAAADGVAPDGAAAEPEAGAEAAIEPGPDPIAEAHAIAVEACDAGIEAAAAGAAEKERSPWSVGLVMSILALTVGGGSAVLGIWVDRDKSRPVIFAMAMSVLITAAISVGMVQGFLDAEGAIQKEEDLERMLDMTYEIAKSTGDPELIALIEKEADLTVEPDPQPVAEAPSDEAGEDAGAGGANGVADEGADTDAEAAEGDAAGQPTPEDAGAAAPSNP